MTELGSKASKRYWFISFNKYSGNIVSVSKHMYKPNDDTLSIKSTDDKCPLFIKGLLNKKSYSMIWDVMSNDWVLDKKSNKVDLYKEASVFPLTVDIERESLHYTFYKDTPVVDVNVDHEKIKSYFNISDINIIHSESSILNLYITNKNDPDYLLGMIEIPSSVITSQDTVSVPYEESMLSLINWNTVSVYAKPVFKDIKYYVKDKFEKKEKTNFSSKVMGTSNRQKNADINIKYVDNSLEIESWIYSADQLGGRQNIDIIVCDKNPDNFIGTLSFNIEDLKKQKHKHELNFVWPDNPVLVYKVNNLSINVLETNNGND